MVYNQLKLQSQLCFRLYTASRLVTQTYYPLLDELGLTYPQYLVLMALWEEDHQKVMALAHRLYLDSNTMTPLLQRMAQLGLVERVKGDEEELNRFKEIALDLDRLIAHLAEQRAKEKEAVMEKMREERLASKRRRW